MAAEVRSCLHCVLQRAIAAQVARSALLGVTFVINHCNEVRLPVRGRILYRRVRDLLREAADRAQTRLIKLAGLDTLAGKSHVELMASFLSAGGPCVLSRRLPRFVEGELWLEFNELASDGAWN